MDALDRLIWSVDSAACASLDAGRALASSATARASVARPLSSSAFDGTWPPDSAPPLPAAPAWRALPAAWPWSAPPWPGRRQRGLRAQDLVAQLGGVQHHQHLALLDAVVDVDVDLQHRARQLAADVDAARGLQRAVGGDGEREVAARHGLRGVAGRGVGRRIRCHHHRPPAASSTAPGRPTGRGRRYQRGRRLRPAGRSAPAAGAGQAPREGRGVVGAVRRAHRCHGGVMGLGVGGGGPQGCRPASSHRPGP
jgi:hypothetical protein